MGAQAWLLFVTFTTLSWTTLAFLSNLHILISTGFTNWKEFLSLLLFIFIIIEVTE